MPLAGTGKVLGASIASALGLKNADSMKAWEVVGEVIVAHVIANAQVVGKTPANGELGGGKIV